MTPRQFIQDVLKKLEAKWDSMFVYAYKQGFGETKMWVVSVSDYDTYMGSEFRDTAKRFREEAQAVGVKVLFVCGFVPSEASLMELAENNSLILSI